MLQFQELPCSSTASAKERIGLRALSLAYESRPHTLPDDTQTLLDAVSSLLDSVEAAIAFVDDVLVSWSRLCVVCAVPHVTCVP
jgi:hypothetical protein